MRIASFNVNSLRARMPIVLDWLANTKPDMLCVRETKVQDKDFPAEDQGSLPRGQAGGCGYQLKLDPPFLAK